MLKKLTLPIAVLALLVIAAPAQARKKPSERARIHALEKQVKHLRSDVADLVRASAVQTNQFKATLTLVENLYGCLGILPVDRAVFVPPGATDPITTLQVSTAASPANWLLTMKQSCLVLPASTSSLTLKP